MSRRCSNDLLTGLSPRQSIAVVVRFYEDLSEASIAEVLRCLSDVEPARCHLTAPGLVLVTI
jgi:hypothetical protein